MFILLRRFTMNQKPARLAGLALLPIVSLLAQSAQAELIIHTSKDDSGRTSMVVNQDKQKQLPPAQLGISPARINETVSLTNNKNTARLNQSLTLYNYGSKPKSIRLNLIDIDTATGKPIAPNENTLKPWTLINPTEFTIAPGGYQTVRLSLRPPVQFATGTHSAMLSIEQQVDKALTYDADGQGVTVEIGSRYGLPITFHIE
ncbi:hypothetical protein [Psychrobacter lutiphocae]|uniref:hypothetical protein n=1 Tax=Psychrobacter lutiphocae TaxID=540500 RepID=UPI00036D3DD2|nr:hypothetical protein [Psychrobacter lutiphocae]